MVFVTGSMQYWVGSGGEATRGKREKSNRLFDAVSVHSVCLLPLDRRRMCQKQRAYWNPRRTLKIRLLMQDET
jgi:hypothetical protein